MHNYNTPMSSIENSEEKSNQSPSEQSNETDLTQKVDDISLLKINNAYNCFPVDEDHCIFFSNKQVVLTKGLTFLASNKTDFKIDYDIPECFASQLAEGKIYVRNLDNVYEVSISGQTNKIKQQSNTYICALNNRAILCKNNWDSKYYDIDQKEIKQLKPSALLRTWGGCGLKIYDKKRKVELLDRQWKGHFVCDIDEQQYFCACFQGYFAVVFDNDESDKMTAVNMINGKFYQTTMHKLNRNEAHESLFPTFCGLTFSDRVLMEVMGKADFAQFLIEREQKWDEWRSLQFSSANFPMEELNELLQKGGVQLQSREKPHMKRFQMRLDCYELRVLKKSNVAVNKYLARQVVLKQERVKLVRSSISDIEVQVRRMLE